MTETLLLIEDDITLCEALRFMLTKKGFQVEVANSAITGLQKAYAVKPDAIIWILCYLMDGWNLRPFQRCLMCRILY
jgi:DNA-binding response OmpR family regulator